MLPSPATTLNHRYSRRFVLCAHVVRTSRKAAEFPVLAMLLSLPSGVAMLGHGAYAADLQAVPPGQADHAGTRTASHPENVVVHIQPRPPIQTYPHANPVGQPLRMSGAENRKNGHQYDWGVFNRGNGEAAGFGPVGVYGVAPWAEDWSRLRTGRKSSDPFDVLKYIPLTRSGNVWISFSGETRLRNWFESRPQLGTQKPNDSGRFGVRNLYGADLHIGSHLRFFGQLVNADAAGWGGYGYGSTYRKRLDAQQAFVETRWNMLGAKSGFIFGRQQFLDAPSYMLYNRETPNVPLSWDGFRAYMVWKRIRIDGWDFVQTYDSENKMFHDTENYATRLYGFNTTWRRQISPSWGRKDTLFLMRSILVTSSVGPLVLLPGRAVRR